VQKVASNGYVRNKLTVFHGGQATSHGNTALSMEQTVAYAADVSATTAVIEADTRSEQIRAARMKGYEGDSCGECGNFTLVRNGTCLKCDTCGSTSGCS
jgi:ribonucleoside-diphosphate reductase alpha chain